MRHDPHHLLAEAYREVHERKEATSPKARELVLALQGRALREGLEYAIDKYENEEDRHYIESMLVAGGPIELVRAATEMPLAAVTAYDEFIFDQSVFRDRLDRRNYVRELAATKTIDEDAFKLYQSAMVIGPDVIAWRLNNSKEVERMLKPGEIIRRCLGDAMFRGLSHRLMPNVELTKNHVAWMKYTKELAVELNKIDPADARDAEDALKVALRHEDKTVNASSSGIPQEKILH
jgi:hypothetical protein